MDSRLEALYSLVEQGIGVIDVGTDHGYIPTSLAVNGYSGNLIAADINAKPLDSAKATAIAAGVEKSITFLLSDGLDNCSADAVDTIIIAGMGGDTICGILDRAEWCLVEKCKLILQPMTKPEVVRYWLINNGFSIRKEALAEAEHKVYQIICASYGGKTEICDAELYTGSFDVLHMDMLYKKHIEIYINKFEKILAGMRGANECTCSRQKIYLQILTDLKEMEKHCYDS